MRRESHGKNCLVSCDPNFVVDFILSVLPVDFVDLPTVEGVFERHGFPASQDTIVDASGLYNILVDIFLLIRNTESTRNKNKEQSAELLLNWILNLYDVYGCFSFAVFSIFALVFVHARASHARDRNRGVPCFRNRTGSIRVLSVKISLAALCCARLVEKRKCKSSELNRGAICLVQCFELTCSVRVSDIFKQLRDHTNHISRKKMTVFLHTMAQVWKSVSTKRVFLARLFLFWNEGRMQNSLLL